MAAAMILAGPGAPRAWPAANSSATVFKPEGTVILSNRADSAFCRDYSVLLKSLRVPWIVLASAEVPDSVRERDLVIVGGPGSEPTGELIARCWPERGRRAGPDGVAVFPARGPGDRKRVVAIASGSTPLEIRNAADSVMAGILAGAGTRDDWFLPAGVGSRAEAEEQILSLLHLPDGDELPLEELRLPSSRRSGGTIGAAQAAEDVGRFFRLLAHGWCGYGYFRRQGDFAAAKQNILAEVGGRSRWSPDGLAEAIAERLDFVHDCHLSIGHRRFCGHLHFWYDTKLQLRWAGPGYRFSSGGTSHTVLAVNGRPPREYVFPSLNAGGDPVYRLGVLSRSEPAPLVLTTHDGRTTRRWTVRLRRSEPGAYAGAPLKFGEDRIGGIPVLRVRSFRDQYANELLRFLDAAERHRGAPYLILDIRGNLGGNDSWPWQWIERFTGRAPFPKVISTSLISKTTMMGLANGRAEEGAAVPEVVKERFRRDVAAYGASADSFERGLQRPYWTPLRFPEARRIPNPTTLIVVTDGSVASAGEGLLSYLFRQVENVVVVGENSAGAVTFGQTSVHRLPHSGLRVVLPIQLLIRSDLRWTEERGFDPDLWVPAGEALNCAVAAVRKGTISTVTRLPAGYFAGAFVPERPPWRNWLSGNRRAELAALAALVIVGAVIYRFARRRPGLLIGYGIAVLVLGAVVLVNGALSGGLALFYGAAFGLLGVFRKRRR